MIVDTLNLQHLQEIAPLARSTDIHVLPRARMSASEVYWIQDIKIEINFYAAVVKALDVVICRKPLISGT